jgi:hypothetical protein
MDELTRDLNKMIHETARQELLGESLLEEEKKEPDVTKDLGDVQLKKKPDADYWYVKRGAATLGVVSKGKGDGYDADTDPEGEGHYKKGFDSVKAAAKWIIKRNDDEDPHASALARDKGPDKKGRKDPHAAALGAKNEDILDLGASDLVEQIS